jgi:hypothetical protein
MQFKVTASGKVEFVLEGHKEGPHMSDFRFPAQSICELRSTGLLRSE